MTDTSQRSDRSGADNIDRTTPTRLGVSTIAFMAWATIGLLIRPLCRLLAFLFPAVRKDGRLRRSFAGMRGPAAVITITIGPVWYGWQYKAEAVPDHRRVDFSTIEDGRGLDLCEGHRICIKGYAFHSGHDTPQLTVYLSPDGSFRRPERIIAVDVPAGWKFSDDPIAVSGTLEVNQHPSPFETRYILRAAEVRFVQTAIGLLPRAPWDGC